MNMNDLVIVSVDDHIVEPGNMYDNHLTQAQKAFAPKMLKNADGSDYWTFEGRKSGAVGLNAVAGRVREEYGMEPASLDQMRRGSWDVHARIDDMNANGLLASLNFPSVVQFDGSIFLQYENKAHAKILVSAYNDWHIDEWCGAHPGRFIPCAILPFWDVAATVEEVKRVAAKGCHAVTFCDNPSLKGLPGIHDESWEPFWKICAELNVTICLHIGSGMLPPHASPQSPIDCWIITMPMAIGFSTADWLYLRALQRYPNLKIALSEGGIGWIPYLLERCDYTFEHHHAWTHTDFGGKKPSQVFREHFLTCFIDDEFGLANLDRIGPDIVSYECDYPHSDTLWPEAPEYLSRTIKHLSAANIDKVTHGNAMRFFNFDPFSKLGGRQNCTVGALRAKAKNVDTSPQSYGGHHPLAKGEAARMVTSGDIMQMLAHAMAAK
jgi:predicted TIM-barrel fold metal-dependent hydrolase